MVGIVFLDGDIAHVPILALQTAKAADDFAPTPPQLGLVLTSPD